MPQSINPSWPGRRLGWREPRWWSRILLGVLVAANVAAALWLARPWESSVEQLLARQASLRRELGERQRAVARLQQVAQALEQAREQSRTFVQHYFLDQRQASSTILAELKQAAESAGLKQLDHTFEFQPVEGAADLGMLSITGNYRGRYENLVQFVRLIDRAPRLIILDTLTVVPEQQNELKINMKLYAFVVASGEHPSPVSQNPNPTQAQLANAAFRSRLP